MNLNELTKIGSLKKPKGLKGAIKVFFEDFFFVYLQNNSPDYVYVKQATFLPYFIEELKAIEDSFFLIKFEDINTRHEAFELLNCDLWLEKNKFPDRVEEELDWEYLMNYQLENQEFTVLGIIENIITFPKHTLIQITYQEKEVLLPLHPELILNIDKQQQILRLNIADGLLDVYLSDLDPDLDS